MKFEKTEHQVLIRNKTHYRIVDIWELGIRYFFSYRNSGSFIELRSNYCTSASGCDWMEVYPAEGWEFIAGAKFSLNKESASQ